MQQEYFAASWRVRSSKTILFSFIFSPQIPDVHWIENILIKIIITISFSYLFIFFGAENIHYEYV